MSFRRVSALMPSYLKMDSNILANARFGKIFRRNLLDSCIVNLRRNALQKSERSDAVIPENGFKYIGKCALRKDIPKKLT